MILPRGSQFACREYDDVAERNHKRMLRTLDRGERVSRGMRARGGARPPSPYGRSRTVDWGDYALVALAAVAVVSSGVIRWGP